MQKVISYLIVLTIILLLCVQVGFAIKDAKSLEQKSLQKSLKVTIVWKENVKPEKTQTIENVRGIYFVPLKPHMVVVRRDNTAEYVNLKDVVSWDSTEQ